MRRRAPRPGNAAKGSPEASIGPRALAPGALDTFLTDLPVQAGDTIGMYEGSDLESTRIACRFPTTNGDDLPAFDFNSPPAGPVEVLGTNQGFRVNLSATVLLSPTVDSLATTAGPLTGGTSVTVSGKEFEHVTAVDFGGVAAKSFTVDSAGQITAVSPAGGAGPVSVTVTTAWGTTASSRLFTYMASAPKDPPQNEMGPALTAGPTAPDDKTGSASTPGSSPQPSPAASCRVPKLAGKKLSTAKKAITAAHCKVGTVIKKKGVTAKTGKVVKQSPKVGTSKPAGSKVNLTLG